MENIYTASKPFYLFAKFLGLFPFSYDGPAAKGLLTIKWHGIASTTLAFVVCFLLLVLNIFGDEKPPISSPLMIYTWIIWTIIATFLVLIQLFIQTRKYQSIKDFLRAVDNFDKKAESLNLTVDFNQHKKYCKLLILCIILICTTLQLGVPTFAQNEDISRGSILLTTSVYQMIHNWFFTSQFALAALTLRERFKIINTYFSGFLNDNGSELKTFTNVRQKNLNLKLFTELYNNLCDAIEIINSNFTINIFFVLTVLLLTDIFAAYCFLREFRSSSHMLDFIGFVNAAWTVIMFFIKALMAYSGNSTTSEAERSLIIVTKAMVNAYQDIELRNELSFVLIQMKFRKKNLANVFFNINWSLILTVTSTIVTYLIITCQFDSLNT